MDIKQLQEYMREVPFGNSIFQINHFTHGDETPERKVRNCLLQINQKLCALQECKYERDLMEIEVDEIDEKLSIEGTGKFEKRRLEVRKKQILFKLKNQIKFIEDAEIEISAYLGQLNSLPKITREQFEGNELAYWSRRLMNDARIEYKCNKSLDKGTLKSLNSIGIADISIGDRGNIEYSAESQIVKLLNGGKSGSVGENQQGN